MTHLARLLITIAVIFASIALGYWLRRSQERGQLKISASALDAWRRRIQTWAIFFLLPFSAMLSLWGLPSPESSLLALPLLGLASYVVGGAAAIAAARILRLNRRQTGSLYCCGTFTNLGAVGGLVCLLFLGENSIALVALYRLLEEIFYFGVSFPIARLHGADADGIGGRPFQPVLAVIILALGAGISLNLLGVPRPDFLGAAASAAMFLATVFFLTAIGLTLRLSRIGAYWRPDLAMCAIKFIISPLVVVPLAICLGLGTAEGGLVLKTAAILSCMPVAMTALVPPALFGLDIDLANSCWLATTAALILVLPALMLVLPQL